MGDVVARRPCFDYAQHERGILISSRIAPFVLSVVEGRAAMTGPTSLDFAWDERFPLSLLPTPFVPSAVEARAICGTHAHV